MSCFFCTYLNKFEIKVDVFSLHHEGKWGSGGGGGNLCWAATDVLTEGTLSFSPVPGDRNVNKKPVTSHVCTEHCFHNRVYGLIHH